MHIINIKHRQNLTNKFIEQQLKATAERNTVTQDESDRGSGSHPGSLRPGRFVPSPFLKLN